MGWLQRHRRLRQTHVARWARAHDPLVEARPRLAGPLCLAVRLREVLVQMAEVDCSIRFTLFGGVGENGPAPEAPQDLSSILS